MNLTYKVSYLQSCWSTSSHLNANVYLMPREMSFMFKEKFWNYALKLTVQSYQPIQKGWLCLFADILL